MPTDDEMNRLSAQMRWRRMVLKARPLGIALVDLAAPPGSPPARGPVPEVIGLNHPLNAQMHMRPLRWAPPAVTARVPAPPPAPRRAPPLSGEMKALLRARGLPE